MCAACGPDVILAQSPGGVQRAQHVDPAAPDQAAAEASAEAARLQERVEAQAQELETAQQEHQSLAQQNAELQAQLQHANERGELPTILYTSTGMLCCSAILHLCLR